MYGEIALFTGNSNPELGQEDLCAHGQGPVAVHGRSVQRRRNPRRAARQRSWTRRVPHPEHLRSAERQPDGAADHGRGVQALLGRPDHGGHAVLRLRTPGSQGSAPCAHHSQAGGGSCSRPRGSTGCSRWTCTQVRFRASSTSPSTTSTPSRCCTPTCATGWSTDAKNTVVVSPDAGGVERARSYAKRLHSGLAIIDKRRSGPNEAEVMHIVGDVKDQTAIVVDDMIDTAGHPHEGRWRGEEARGQDDLRRCQPRGALGSGREAAVRVGVRPRWSSPTPSR